MNRYKCLFVALFLLGVPLMVTACSSPGVTPTPQPIALAPATATTAPPTNTAVPPTDTPVPPTETPVPPTETPTPTATSTLTPMPTATATLTPTASVAPATATRKPPPPPTVVARVFTVTWKTGIEYTAQTANSFWCKLHNEYQNNSTEDMPFQVPDTVTNYFFLGKGVGTVGGYEPVFGIANPDGSINRWGLGGWYAKRFGWRNGYDEFPPGPIKAGTASGDWTFYSNGTNGQYCRYAYVKWKGQISAAEFSPNGDLVNTNAKLPAGAP